MESNSYPFYCGNCWWIKHLKIPLKLLIVETTDWDGNYTRSEKDEKEQWTGEIMPTFDIETGEGVASWEAKFVCPNCKQEEWLLNQGLIYDEDKDQLFIPNMDPDETLGWKRPAVASYGPEELPKIQHLKDIQVKDEVFSSD